MSDETEDERWERLSRDRIHRPLPKQFYKAVAVTDQLGIALDDRNVKTPLKAPLIYPTGLWRKPWQRNGTRKSTSSILTPCR